jgi:hypothetical protein
MSLKLIFEFEYSQKKLKLLIMQWFLGVSKALSPIRYFLMVENSIRTSRQYCRWCLNMLSCPDSTVMAQGHLLFMKSADLGIGL